MKIYFSHKISNGDGEPSAKEMQKNCETAVEIAEHIQYQLSSTDIDLYVPGAATERFVNIAYTDGYLTVEQILEIDCKIIDTCDVLICYVPIRDTLLGGRAVEIEYAEKTHKPYCIFAYPQQAVIWLTHTILRADY